MTIAFNISPWPVVPSLHAFKPLLLDLLSSCVRVFHVPLTCWVQFEQCCEVVEIYFRSNHTWSVAYRLIRIWRGVFLWCVYFSCCRLHVTHDTRYCLCYLKAPELKKWFLKKSNRVLIFSLHKCSIWEIQSSISSNSKGMYNTTVKSSVGPFAICMR